MEQRIYKYHLPTPIIPVDFDLNLPIDAQILTVQTQKGVPCIWAIVNPSNPSENKLFCYRGTGQLLSGDEGKYIGTFQIENSDLVFHLFEGKE
jgi:hypothetical protein